MALAGLLDGLERSGEGGADGVRPVARAGLAAVELQAVTTATATLVIGPRNWEWEFIALYLVSSALDGCDRKQQQRMLRYLLDRYQP